MVSSPDTFLGPIFPLGHLLRRSQLVPTGILDSELAARLALYPPFVHHPGSLFLLFLITIPTKSCERGERQAPERPNHLFGNSRIFGISQGTDPFQRQLEDLPPGSSSPHRPMAQLRVQQPVSVCVWGRSWAGLTDRAEFSGVGFPSGPWFRSYRMSVDAFMLIKWGNHLPHPKLRASILILFSCSTQRPPPEVARSPPSSPFNGSEGKCTKRLEAVTFPRVFTSEWKRPTR